MSTEWEKYMAEHGIEQQHMTQATPQQNGVAERELMGLWMRALLLYLLMLTSLLCSGGRLLAAFSMSLISHLHLL